MAKKENGNATKSFILRVDAEMMEAIEVDGKRLHTAIRYGVSQAILDAVAKATKRLMSELPFMATENIMMDAVKAGGDRQELHEKIRQLSMEAGKNVKEEGKDNNLLELIAADPEFNLTLEALQSTMDPAKYVGRAPIQVDKFIANVVKPILDANKEELGVKAEINV